MHLDGRIRSPYVPGQGNLWKLVVRTIRELEGARSARQLLKMPEFGEAFDPKELLHIPEDLDVGTKGTRLPLPTLNGGYVGLDDLRGTRTVLPSWGPDCAFCQRMLPKLK